MSTLVTTRLKGGGDALGGGIADAPLFYTVTSVLSTPINDPEFSFYIPNSEFYINTPGISISDNKKSVSNFNDGLFYFLNKTNSPIYYNNFLLNNNGKIRASFLNNHEKVINVISSSINVENEYTYTTYVLSYKNKIIGKLITRILNVWYNKERVMLAPFESIDFSIVFVSENVSDLNNLYFGKTNITPDRRIGVIDFSFNFYYYNKNPINEVSDLISETMVVSINLVNTGYISGVINGDKPDTGGYNPLSSIKQGENNNLSYTIV